MKKSCALYITFLLAVVLLLPSCISGNKGGPTIHVTDPTMTTTTSLSPSETTDESNPQTTTSPTQPSESETSADTSTTSDSSEKMVVSADPTNPYIVAVSQKYGVDTSNLVAFYASSMQKNGNLVYEFDGSIGSDGRPVRTKNTLKNIYTVSPPPELLAKKATGTAAEGNEYTEKETKLCEYFTKNVVFRFFGKDIQNA